jgi:hypothetical protein
MKKAKALTTFIRVLSLFRYERLSADLKPTLHRFPAWEIVADAYILKQ